MTLRRSMTRSDETSAMPIAFVYTMIKSTTQAASINRRCVGAPCHGALLLEYTADKNQTSDGRGIIRAVFSRAMRIAWLRDSVVASLCSTGLHRTRLTLSPKSWQRTTTKSAHARQ